MTCILLATNTGGEREGFVVKRALSDLREIPGRLVSFSATLRPFLLSTMSALGICSLPMDTIFCIIQGLTSCHAESGVTERRPLALTCRFLSEPALDTMWHTLNSLSPLLCTLPEDLCTLVPLTLKSTRVESVPWYQLVSASFLLLAYGANTRHTGLSSGPSRA